MFLFTRYPGCIHAEIVKNTKHAIWNPKLTITAQSSISTQHIGNENKKVTVLETSQNHKNKSGRLTGKNKVEFQS